MRIASAKVKTVFGAESGRKGLTLWRFHPPNSTKCTDFDGLVDVAVLRQDRTVGAATER